MKRIRHSSDLAINGAAPAFASAVHVGRPNIGDRDKLRRLVDKVLDNRWLTNDGPMVRELEQRLAEALQVRNCVCVCNGTIGLELAYQALGLTGEVIVPAYTFIATAHALERVGVTPVFADIDPRTHNLDPESVRRLVTDRTSGIVPVHLWGRAADVGALAGIADEFGLKLVFDAAHAFGSTCGGLPIGRFGNAEVMSFHATKFFNTLEGGAITTDDDALAKELRLMRNFGFSGYDRTERTGTNGKMNEVCAAMGLVNLDALPDVVEANRRIHERYRTALSGIPGLHLVSYGDEEKNNFQYVVLEVDDRFPVSRDEVMRVLQAENVLVRRYFWPGCHRMEPYAGRQGGAVASLPATEAVAGRVLVLPTGTALPDGAIELQAEVLALLSRQEGGGR